MYPWQVASTIGRRRFFLPTGLVLAKLVLAHRCHQQRRQPRQPRQLSCLSPPQSQLQLPSHRTLILLLQMRLPCQLPCQLPHQLPLLQLQQRQRMLPCHPRGIGTQAVMDGRVTQTLQAMSFGSAGTVTVVLISARCVLTAKARRQGHASLQWQSQMVA